MNCLWNVHLKWGLSVANIIKNAYLIVIMSLNVLSVVNKTKKRPLFPCWKLNAAQVIRNIEMKLAVPQTLICTTADDILLCREKRLLWWENYQFLGVPTFWSGEFLSLKSYRILLSSFLFHNRILWFRRYAAVLNLQRDSL